MNSRHEGGVDAEVSAGCAAKGTDDAGQNPEHLLGFTFTNSFQDPHGYQ
jgi:hypothetical protein